MKRRSGLAIVLIIIIVLASAGGAFYLQEIRLGKKISEGNEKILNLETQLTSIQGIPKAYVVVFNKALKAGQEITEADLMTVAIDEPIKPTNVVTNKSDLIGQLLKIDVSMYQYASTNVCYSQTEIADDIREQEFSYLIVPEKLEQGDYVDLRIKFPTGQDYTVLSKKFVADFMREYSAENELIQEMVWLYLDETEIIRMGSAVVDAYLNGAEMYLIKYVDGTVQEAADITYPENFPVLEMISEYPELIQQATVDLELARRKELEDSLGEMFTEEMVSFTMPTTITVPEVQVPVTTETTETAEATTEVDTAETTEPVEVIEEEITSTEESVTTEQVEETETEAEAGVEGEEIENPEKQGDIFN